MDIAPVQKNFLPIFFDFDIIPFELVALNTPFYLKRILVIGCQFIKKQSQDFRYYQDRIFRDDFLSEWSRNMTKILPCRFKQCFGPCNMLTVHKCSDTRVFRLLSKLDSSFFSKYSKFYLDFANEEKNRENIFEFGDNCIWIGCVKHLLLLRENTSHPVSIW